MSQPRDLSKTLPSPSEQNNFDKCQCFWWIHDRLWIKPTKDKIAFLFGRLVDKTMEKWMLREITNPVDCLSYFDALVQGAEHDAAPEEFDNEEFTKFAVSVRDAITAWLTLYGNVKEEVISVQSKFSIDATVKVDYLIRIPPGLVRIRERKIISPFADIDLEVAKYQLGFQPLAYAHQVEKAVGMPIEAVEFEFFIRSAPAYGKKKPIPAAIRRECVYVTDWKKRMWEASAEYANYCMQVLEQALPEDTPFELIPRRTMNCMTKLGMKTYECDYYKACKVNINPLLLSDDFYQSGGKNESSNPATTEVVQIQELKTGEAEAELLPDGAARCWQDPTIC